MRNKPRNRHVHCAHDIDRRLFIPLDRAQKVLHEVIFRCAMVAEQQLLRRMKETAALPVLVKPAHAARLPEEARRVFALEARCTALYDICRREFGRTAGRNEYEEGPVRG